MIMTLIILISLIRLRQCNAIESNMRRFLLLQSARRAAATIRRKRSGAIYKRLYGYGYSGGIWKTERERLQSAASSQQRHAPAAQIENVGARERETKTPSPPALHTKEQASPLSLFIIGCYFENLLFCSNRAALDSAPSRRMFAYQRCCFLWSTLLKIRFHGFNKSIVYEELF